MHVYLGPCPTCGSRTFDYGGGWACLAPHCRHNVNQIVCSNPPAPDWWDTINVSRDGDMWSASNAATFVNLAESPCGFGRTPQEAVADLRKQIADLPQKPDDGAGKERP
jgi:hypothetical protein